MYRLTYRQAHNKADPHHLASCSAMGQCCSTEGQQDKYEKQQDHAPATDHRGIPLSPFAAPRQQQTSSAPVTAKDKQAHREVNWKATGIIGLRDQSPAIKALPASISSVGADARVLDASNNKLGSLAGLEQLHNLQRLVLGSNALRTLPGDILIKLLQLKILVLDNNHLTTLPEELGQLQKLEQLSVNQNQLVALPGLASCVRLRKLAVKGNQITELPEHLPPEVEEIDASINKVQAIPHGFSLLVKLTTLNLDSNQVATVPPDVLLNCAALHTLSLHNNPITPDVLQANPAFQAFEQRRRSKYDKVIGGGCMLGNKGLDEGVDRKV